jgi:predicted metal-dependent peptidase
MDVKEKLRRAISSALVRNPFFGRFLLDTEILVSNSAGETACTDGQRILVNPSFLDGLTVQETVGLVLHEAYHIIFGHVWRKEGRDHMTWNVATDAWINDTLRGDMYHLPKGGVDMKGAAKKSSELLYEELLRNTPPQGRGQGQGNGQGQNAQPWGDHGQWGKTPTPADKKNLLDRLKKAKASASQGDVPQEIARVIEDLEVSLARMEWDRILSEFMTPAAKDDFTYMYRDNRMWSQDPLVFPGEIVEDALEDLVIAIDTSGSIGDEYLRVFAKRVLEIYALFSDDVRLTILFADAAVASVMDITVANSPEDVLAAFKQAKGGGGTDFRPVFKWTAKNRPTTSGVVDFTDTFGTFPNDAPFRTLWVGGGPETMKFEEPPFGRFVVMAI